MTNGTLVGIQVLAVEAQRRLCAVQLGHVVEIMRPLPMDMLAGAPPFVRGVAIIRGAPTPVVDLGILLSNVDDPPGVEVAARFVTLRVGERQVALLVSAVRGVCELDALTVRELPPLLQGAPNEYIEAIGTLDAEMLVILRSGWNLPEVWESPAGWTSPQPRGQIVPDETLESER